MFTNKKIGILSSHPVQYHAPLFRALAQEFQVHVYYAHNPTDRDQAQGGFGVEFKWDIDLLEGYQSSFLKNKSRKPSVNHFFGCDTPEVVGQIQQRKFDVFLVMGWHLLSYWQAIFACRRIGLPILVRGDTL